MKQLFLTTSFIIIVSVGFFFRFYKLGDIPRGFYRDESAIGYNAYSLLHTGKDEYGKAFPLYFKSFGDYKLPLYIYSTVPAIILFGLTPFAVRFPSALFGTLTIVIVYFLVKTLTRNRLLGLSVSALLSISPWAIFYNRATFEVSMCLFFLLLGTYLLYSAFLKKIPGLFFMGTLSFVLSLYGYNLTRLLAPLLFLLVIFVYRKHLRSIPKWEFILTGVATLITLFPFYITFFSNGGVSSAKGTLIFSSAKINAQHLELRSYLIDLPSFITKIFFNQFVLGIWQYIQNVISYFSVPYFFITGESGGNLAMGIGYLYLFSFPLIIWGIVIALKEKKDWQKLLLGWGLLTVLVASLTREIPQATRSYFLLFPLTVFSGLGLVSFVSSFYNRKTMLSRIAFVGCVIVMAYNIIYFLGVYFYRFPLAYTDTWKEEDKNIALYLKENTQNYRHIIIDPSVDLSYTSLLFFQKYPPQQFLSSVVRTPDDSEGFTQVVRFGKYEYRAISWEKDYPKKDTFIVAQPNTIPKNINPVKIFYYPEKPVVLAIKQNIYSYPVTQKAYAIITAQ